MLRPDEVSALDALMQSTMVDLASIARTGQHSIPVRMDLDQVSLRLPGMPEIRQLSRFLVSFPSGTGVVANDVVTVTDPAGQPLGTFSILQDLNTTSYSFSDDYYAMMIARPDGSLNLETNATVTFRSKNDIVGGANDAGPVAARIDPAYADMRYAGANAEATWALYWPTSLSTYPGPATGSPPVYPTLKNGDLVYWTGFRNGKGTLHAPMAQQNGFPVYRALVTEDR